MSLNTTAINIHTPASNYRIRPNWNGKPYGVIQEDHMPCWAEFSITDTPRTHTITEPPKDSDADEYAFAVDSVRVPVNTVDEWLLVTSGVIPEGDLEYTNNVDDDLQADSNSFGNAWVTCECEKGNMVPINGKHRRRNPNYKPTPFTPRPATWEDVRVGAVLRCIPSGVMDWRVGQVDNDLVATIVGLTGETLRIGRGEIKFWILISPAPEAKP